MLDHAVRRGFQLLPLPLHDCAGETVVEEAGFLWELAPELPGRADYRTLPRRERLKAAARVLAQFHGATADFPMEVCQGPSPTVVERLDCLAYWRGSGVAALLEAVRRGVEPDLDRRAWAIVQRFQAGADEVDHLLRQAATLLVPLGPAIRDIWCDNVLFQGDEVAGIVDFGSMGADARAVDVARLIGSMAKECLESWQAGMEEYASVFPLDPTQRNLAVTLARSGAILGGMVWLDWVYVEKRHFEDASRVLRRLDDFVPLPNLFSGKIL